MATHSSVLAWEIPWTEDPDGLLPGASVRNSACGTGHEEGGSAYAKAGSSLRSPPGNSQASTPQNQNLPTLLLCAFTYTSDFMGDCPPPPLSEKELTYSSS